MHFGWAFVQRTLPVHWRRKYKGFAGASRFKFTVGPCTELSVRWVESFLTQIHLGSVAVARRVQRSREESTRSDCKYFWVRGFSPLIIMQCEGAAMRLTSESLVPGVHHTLDMSKITDRTALGKMIYQHRRGGGAAPPHFVRHLHISPFRG